MKAQYNTGNRKIKSTGKNNFNVGTQTIIQKGDGYKTSKPAAAWWTKLNKTSKVKKRK